MFARASISNTWCHVSRFHRTLSVFICRVASPAANSPDTPDMAESRGSPGNSNVRLPNQVRGLSPIRITTMITTESVCLPEQVSFLVGSDIVGVEESGIAHHPASSSSSSNKEEEENNSNSGGDLCEDVISLGSQDTISDDSSTCGRDTKYTKHHKTLMRSVEPALSIFMFKNPTTFPAQLHQRAIPSISTSKT